MYHHAGADRYSNSPELLDRQFRYIRKRGIRTLLPGGDVSSGGNLCLVFDDAYFDFFQHVFPLLRKHDLCAVLAVPTGYVLEQTDRPAPVRLSVPHDETMDGNVYRTRAPFCTWKEIVKMVSSQRIAVAAHGHRHFAPDAHGLKAWHEDVLLARRTLQNRLGVRCDSLVLPHGLSPDPNDRNTVGAFSHVFGIGDRKYEDWPPPSEVILRFRGDEQPDPRSLVDAVLPRRSLRYRAGQVRRDIRGLFMG